MFQLFAACALGALPCTLFADTVPAGLAAQAVASVSTSGKFSVDGTVLTYDTYAAKNEENREIEGDDVDEFIDLLRASPGVTELVLSSTGGNVWAGEEMARIVIDFELDTRVIEECSSACVTVFLGGERRVLDRGGKLGFHRRSWSSGAMRDYYTDWREDEGWQSPFDFASWVYRDTQNEVFEEVEYMMSRGVEASFAIRTKRARTSMWFPSRDELEAGGVLRE